MTDTVLIDQIVESLAISNRITTYLLEACSDEALAHVLPKGWGLAAQFAHIHNVRLMWLDSAKVTHGLVKFETKSAGHTRVALLPALDASGAALESLIGELLRDGKRMPGFKPHTPGFVSYLVAHHAYHHAEIGIIARGTGFPIDKKHAFGMWEWGSR
jgi:DinB superfamily